MKDSRVHIGLDHKVQRNYVHWDITTVCNYDCSYCYAMREYGSNWNKETSRENITSILNALRLSSLPVFLGLLGGEPTLSKHFNFIIDYLKDNFFKKEDDRVYITSNMSRKNEWFNEFYDAVDFNNKLFWLASWHASQADPEHFIKNVITLLNKGYKVKVNVMLDPDRNQWESTAYVLRELKKLSNPKLILHPHFVYDNEHQLSTYPDNVFDYFNDLISDIPKEFNQDGILYNDSELFKNNLVNFKGWECHLNNYEINLNGDVHKFCVQNSDNLIKNPLYFRKITETIPVICQHKACTCDGLLKIKKVKYE